jgi:hypothetical protein
MKQVGLFNNEREIGYVDRLTGLYLPFPYNNPGNAYERKYGDYLLRYISLNEKGVPYGKRVRSLMSLITSLAVVNNSDFIDLGRVTEAADKIGIDDLNTKMINRLIDTIHQLGGMAISTTSKKVIRGYPILTQENMLIADKVQLCWGYKKRSEKDKFQPELFGAVNYIKLSNNFYKIINNNAIPVDIVAYNSLSMVEQDLYAWLTYKTHNIYVKGLKNDFIKWDYGLYEQFSDNVDPRKKPDFRKEIQKKILKIKTQIYPDLQTEVDISKEGGILIKPSALHIKPNDKRAGQIIVGYNQVT